MTWRDIPLATRIFMPVWVFGPVIYMALELAGFWRPAWDEPVVIAIVVAFGLNLLGVLIEMDNG